MKSLALAILLMCACSGCVVFDYAVEKGKESALAKAPEWADAGQAKLLEKLASVEATLEAQAKPDAEGRYSDKALIALLLLSIVKGIRAEMKNVSFGTMLRNLLNGGAAKNGTGKVE